MAGGDVGTPARIARACGRVAAVVTLAACSNPGFAPHDGSSVSFGPPRSGILRQPSELPRSGPGFVIPERWWRRGLRFGVEELTATVVHVGRQVARRRPGATVSVADLSLPRGGGSRWHRSHQTGRDVDLLFLVTDPGGRPQVAEEMYHFDASGAPIEARAPSIVFDDAGNWQLVRALIENPVSEVQYIFISDDLKQRIIDHAVEAGEPEALILQAGWLLHQPSDSLKHDDHMHVRIYCPREDLDFGCHDFGLMRWHKRDQKYEHRVQRLVDLPPVPLPFHATPHLFARI